MAKISNTPPSEVIDDFFNRSVNKHDIRRTSAPFALFVVGINGSGKSTYIEGLLRRHSSINAFPIQADNYRKLHPFLSVLIDKHGIDHAHTKTGNFAKQFSEKLLDKAFEKRCNVVFESTFGNTDTAKELLLKARRQGYKVKVLALPMDVDKSIARNQARYSVKQLVENTLPRIVEPSVIRRMADNLSYTLQEVERLGVEVTRVTSFDINTKQVEAIFAQSQHNNKRTPNIIDDELKP